MHAPSGTSQAPDGLDGRPTAHLPLPQLFQLSVYWLGINAIWGGIDGVVLQERVPDLVSAGEAGRALALLKTLAVVMAIIIQPTIGSISDYTISRWGRRKPYIAIGATLDVVFLVGLATSQTYLSLLAFLVLLQFSSNFAQGPFQGYVPDLVPGGQVSMASAMVGLMSVLGVVAGQTIASLGESSHDFTLPTIALGLVELATAIGTLIWVQEGRAPRDRSGRSWLAIAREAWGTDILRERSFVWLVASRLFILAGFSTLTNLSVLYMTRSLGLTGPDKGFWVPITSAIVALTIILSTIPSARLSDRFGRKRLIYASCAIGAAGLAVLVLAPVIAVAEAGVVLVGISAGSFLSVDWALMTDIIPKASSGRYMGMSNVATASAGPLAIILGGTLMDAVGGVEQAGSGPRAALVVGVALYALGAAFLRPVDERRREDAPVPAVLMAQAELEAEALS